jgi:hypothetical protein
MEHSKTHSTEVLDRAGMTASIACAVHCAALPLVLMALPALGLAWLDSAWVDWAMVLIAAIIAIRAHRGGIALHGKCFPVGVAVAGILSRYDGHLPAEGFRHHALHTSVWGNDGGRLSLAESAFVQKLCNMLQPRYVEGVKGRCGLPEEYSCRQRSE